MKTACKTCGQEFEPKAIPGFRILPKHCPACSDKADADRATREAEDFRRAQAELWASRCPRLFQTTARDKLPLPDRLERVLDWEYGPMGLMLYGASGKGKSRCAWELIKREFLAGRDFKTFNSMGGVEFAATYGKSSEEAQEYIQGMAQAPILFLDDPFKIKLTEACEAMLFAVVNDRTERMLPIIATLNDTGESLGARMSHDRGLPIIRRFKEFCRPIQF